MLPAAKFDAINSAALAFVEAVGYPAYHDWLVNEESRVRAFMKLPSANAEPEATIPPAPATQRLIDALNYYAEDTNYQPRRNKTPAPVMVDNGKIARGALAAFEGDTDNGSDSEEGAE